MFDFAWSEIAIIAVVALVLIGPKDMPVALKGITDMIKKARRMAGEFQGHVDEMMRDADLGEVREQFREIRSFNIKGAVERAIDSDGTLRRTLSGTALNPDAAAASIAAAPAPPPATRKTLIAAGIAPPEVSLRPGGSPFEVTMPMVGPVALPERTRTIHPPFVSPFGGPVPAEAPAFVPPNAAQPNTAQPAPSSAPAGV